MFKFETKSEQGKLQICVSKEPPTNSKARASRQTQKSQVSERIWSSNEDKFSRRPHTTPSIGIVNLETANRPSGKLRHRSRRHLHDVVDSVSSAKTIVSETADCCRSNRWKSAADITETRKRQLTAESVHPRTAARHTPQHNDYDEDHRVTVSAGSETEDQDNIGEKNEPESIETQNGNRAESHDTQDGRSKAESLLSLGSTSRPETAPTAEDNRIPKRMSLLEQKRLQWANEKAQITDWNPWGRPGGGAPSHQINHNIEINNQTRIDCMHKSNYFTSNRFSSSERRLAKESFSVCKHGRQLPPLNPKASEEGPSSMRILHAAAFSAMGLIGDDGLVRNCACDDWREQERNRWLEDLERQRTEQRQRKLQDKSYYYKNLNDMNIVENANNMDAGCNDFGRTSAPTPSPSQAPSNFNDQIVPRVSEPSIASDVNTANRNNDVVQRTFLRGANVPLDAATQNELATKRQRALEHRKAIQSQLEDRLHQKQEEKARQKHEERQEELRLRQDRELLEKEYVLEQQKVKLKQNTKSEMKKSYEQQPVTSESVKQHHQHSHLPDVLEGTKEIEIKTIEMPKEVDLTDCPEQLTKTPLMQHAPYVHNRVLTPTKFRDKHLMRDFSTQTDSTPKAAFPARKNKSTITSSFSSRKDADSGGRHQNRNKTMKKTGGNRESRPRWGANRPGQNYKTQSEKYLNGEVSKLPNQRRNFQEYFEKTEDLQGVIKTKPRFSGKKTRSSAEHQRKLLAQDESLVLSMQRSMLSPLEASRRPMDTASSEAESTVRDSNNTADNDQCLLTTRHQRRKWQSPSRQEMPNFYTDSPQLPDVRNVRRGITSNNGRPSKDLSPSRGGLDKQPTPTVFRSDSPPVPALRNKMQHGSPNIGILAAAMKEQTSIVGRTSADDSSQPSTAMAAYGLLPSRGDRTESTISFPETDDCTIDLGQRMYDTPLCIQSTENDGQRSEILNKMTLIRQGLFLKQREVEGLLDKRDLKPGEET